MPPENRQAVNRHFLNSISTQEEVLDQGGELSSNPSIYIKKNRAKQRSALGTYAPGGGVRTYDMRSRVDSTHIHGQRRASIPVDYSPSSGITVGIDQIIINGKTQLN